MNELTPYDVAKMIRTERAKHRHLPWDEFRKRFKVDIQEEDVAGAYVELYHHSMSPNQPYFEKMPGSLKDLITWRRSYSYAVRLARDGLLKGVKIDGVLYVDKTLSYVKIDQFSREQDLPIWYILSLIDSGKMKSQMHGDVTHITVADGERAKRQFESERWMTISEAAKKYDLSLEMIRHMTGRSHAVRKRRRLAKNVEWGRNVYVSGKSLDKMLKRMPSSQSWIMSAARAERILGLDLFRELRDRGQFREVKMGRKTMFATMSVREVKQKLVS